MTDQQQRNELGLLKRLNEIWSDDKKEDSELDARIRSYELAYKMQSAAPEAVDLTRESDATRKLYGMDEKETAVFGRNCLLARRMVERGVRFVQLYSGTGSKWDAHSKIEQNHTELCRATDKPIAGLLKDLKARGLLNDTLVLWGGEFGRTPTVEGGGRDGRDHNPEGFTVWLAGGGVKAGFRYGATDDYGWYAAEDKVHVHDLHATVLHLLGLDHQKLVYRYGGRDYSLTDIHGRVVKEVFA